MCKVSSTAQKHCDQYPYSYECLLALQSWLGQQQQQMRASRNIARALMPKTASLEQAGGLHRMVLRGHTGPVGKVLLTPGGTDVVTGMLSLHTLEHTALLTGS